MRGARTLGACALGIVAGAAGAPPASADPRGDASASKRGIPLPSFEFRRTATIRTDNGVPVSARRAPRTSAKRVLRLRDGDRVRILCQRRGERVTGKYGTSRLWDLIEIGGGRGAYVTDTYVYTGSDGRVAPRCARSDGRPPSSDDEGRPHPSRGARRVLRWARRHVAWWRGKYSMTYRLPTDKSIRYMRSHEPPRGGQQGCDCSSFVRWAMAQAGIATGTYTGNMWTANGRMPFTTSNASASSPDGRIVRGHGHRPPGGFRRGDLVFWGVSGLDKDVGHVAIYSGRGRIVQCSGSLGSNAGKSVTYNSEPTGYVRYTRLVR